MTASPLIPNREDPTSYQVMAGWRVGHLAEETTKSGLLVPAGNEQSDDALALIDVDTGQHYWAAPTGAWRFLWPETNRIVVAVRKSQVIAQAQLPEAPESEGNYL